MTNVKKMSWVFLYLVALILVAFSIFYFSEDNLLPAFITSSISMSICTLLIFKNLRFLSSVSFFTILLASLLTLGSAGTQTDGALSGILDEKKFMLALPLFIFFLLVNSIFWAKTKEGFKKIISLLFISLSVFLLLAFGTVSPTYYQNFVYTRINILILLVFSIFLIIKKKRVLGILGIFLSIGILLLSAVMFAEKIYTLEDKKQKEITAYAHPIAEEMLGYYNKEDYDNFCKYCGFVLKNKLNKNPIKHTRKVFGPYTYLGEANRVFRKGGHYYMQYPIKFQNEENLMYFVFIIGEISSDPSVYGFAFLEKQEQ